MEQMIQFTRPDGKTAPGYYIEPAAGKKAPGIVLIQEWWGLNDHMKSVGHRLAKAGFRVLIPDLFRGKVTKDAAKANEWMAGLNFKDATEQDIRGAAEYLKSESQKVGVLGFCMGGALTIAAAVHVPELNAAVCFYGIPPKELADPTKIRIPIQFHFANKDGWCTPAAVDALEQALEGTPGHKELHRYDAEHAFFNDSRPEVYEPDSAKKAWDRSLQFLKSHLGE
jgi:carboxymethylenebutenolidase